MRRIPQLAVVGTAAGLFSGLFGVGGGVVIVPLLVLWLKFGEREATGTSLTAIVIVAAVAAALQASYGNVRVLDGVLTGVPAVAGVLVGVRIQQRVPQPAISIAFAVLLVAAAVQIVL